MSASLGDLSAWIRGQSKSPQVPDLNLIPDELRRKGGLSRDRQLGLLILLELLIIVTIYPSYGSGKRLRHTGWRRDVRGASLR